MRPVSPACMCWLGVRTEECVCSLKGAVGDRERNDTRRRKGKGLTKRFSDIPNLWCRSSRGVAKAALFVSGEHKLPYDDVKDEGLWNSAVGRGKNY